METSINKNTNETRMDKPSPILHAAIRATNGITYIGHRHNNCFTTMATCSVDHIGAIQGFIDENGTFHTREQALKIAKANHQIKTKHPPLDKLLSEDIY